MSKNLRSTKKHILNIVVVLVLVAITLVILITSYKDIDYKKIFDYLKTSNIWLIIAAFFCMVAGIVFEGLSLHIIARKMGHKGKVLSSIAYSSADIYYSAITPSASGGQPASAYYMVKDGMGGGTTSFTLVFNTLAYSTSLIVLIIAAVCIRPMLFVDARTGVKVLIILGIVIQSVLLVLLYACMKYDRAVLKITNAIITLFVKLHIIKKEEKWRTRAANAVDKYASCYEQARRHKLLFIEALILNLCQRVVRVICSCLVCMAADSTTDFWNIFVLQSFVMVGYTSLPVPGGVGAFEYLYISLYGMVYSNKEFIAWAMMVMRGISYYLSMVVSGLYTLVYHLTVTRHRGEYEKASPAPAAVAYGDLAKDGDKTTPQNIENEVENTENIAENDGAQEISAQKSEKITLEE